MTLLHKTIYFKLKLTELTDEWVESSMANSVKTMRQSNHTQPIDRYVMIKFKENMIPASLYIKEAGNELTQEEALAEVGGKIWL